MNKIVVENEKEERVLLVDTGLLLKEHTENDFVEDFLAANNILYVDELKKLISSEDLEEKIELYFYKKITFSANGIKDLEHNLFVYDSAVRYEMLLNLKGLASLIWAIYYGKNLKREIAFDEKVGNAYSSKCNRYISAIHGVSLSGLGFADKEINYFRELGKMDYSFLESLEIISSRECLSERDIVFKNKATAYVEYYKSLPQNVAQTR